MKISIENNKNTGMKKVRILFVREKYLTFPKFRVTLIFAQKRCAKIKLTIFAHNGCAKINIFCLRTIIYNDTAVVTMFNQYFKPLCKTTQIVAILFHCFKFVSSYIFCIKLYFLPTARKLKSRETRFSQGARKLNARKLNARK